MVRRPHLLSRKIPRGAHPPDVTRRRAPQHPVRPRRHPLLGGRVVTVGIRVELIRRAEGHGGLVEAAECVALLARDVELVV